MIQQDNLLTCSEVVIIVVIIVIVIVIVIIIVLSNIDLEIGPISLSDFFLTATSNDIEEAIEASILLSHFQQHTDMVNGNGLQFM